MVDGSGHDVRAGRTPMATATQTRSAIPAPVLKEWEGDLDLVRRTVASGASDDEFATFLHQARRSGLDPLAKQIHYVKRAGKGTVQVGIDGLRLIADRPGNYAGNDDAVFEPASGGGKFPVSASVTIYKMIQGQRCPFTARARWDEYYPGDTLGFQWKRMPHVMLAKCAEALALRKAFPADLSGLYVNEEMAHADAAVTPSAAASSPYPEPSELQGDALIDAAMAHFEIRPAASSPGGESEGKDAFGYRPLRWPTKKMWTEAVTDSQRSMMKIKCDERSIVEELRPTLRRIVLEKYGVKEADTKAAVSLYIDWLINSKEATIDAGCEAAEVALEGGETFPTRA